MPNLRRALTLSPVYLQWNIFKDSFHKMFSGVNALKAFVRTTSLIFVCSLPLLHSFWGWLHPLAGQQWLCEHTSPLFPLSSVLLSGSHFGSFVALPCFLSIFTVCLSIHFCKVPGEFITRRSISNTVASITVYSWARTMARAIAKLSVGYRLWKS